MEKFNNPLGAIGPGKAKPPAEKRPVKPRTGLNSKPDKSINPGAVPAMMGDVKKNPKPDVSMIAPSTAPARAAGSPDQRSGIDMAMATMADKMHPTGR